MERAARFFASEADIEELARDVEGFKANYTCRLREWTAKLQRINERGQRAVIWGSGSKAVAYLTTLGIGDGIAYVVDINPYKHGMYLAGTGHKIVPPEYLQDERPDVVIVMNPIYCDEIRQDLDRMDIAAELIAV